MGKEYKSNPLIEEPFLQQMLMQMDGRKLNATVSGRAGYVVTCPRCLKRKARMFLHKNQETYMFLCPRDGCKLELTLNDLIMRYAPDNKIRFAWNRARWKTWYDPSEYGWYPIKNRKS